ncbi:redoxin domain-containing protein [Candidatus Gottesmanbacteria bacterium]|nr:redoxin domain-containing protein [Candidatus Gottesmanbacteria bacterium]
MNNKIIFVAVLALLLLGGGYFLLSNNKSAVDDNIPLKKESNVMNDGGYQGKVIAGSTTPYLDFNQDDYQKALSENKIIFLNFYANWCPICRAESPDINQAFDQMSFDDVVGFRVNFNDDQTDEDEKTLAKQFAIPYQHTKVILVNGEEVLQKTEKWNSDQVIEEINNYR